MIAGDIPDIPELISLNSIKVHAPSLVVFICGGELEDINKPPKSLRDLFMRHVDKSPLKKHTIFLAEDPQIFSPIGEYVELLNFETDIAQLTELLVLFCESPGSMVELGMFSVDEEISPKLMVIIDDRSYEQHSFINLGPLFSLRLRHGEAAVCVLNLPHLGIDNISNIERINVENFLELLSGPFARRLKQKREPATFNKTRHGHVTKLITGLIQHYAALTLEEIDALLYCLDVPTPWVEIKRHVQCAERFGWLYIEHAGTDTYYAAKPAAELQAIDYDLLPNSPIKDKLRWRTSIREHWKSSHQLRFNIIGNAMRGGAI